MGRALFALGWPGEASEHLQRALELDPGDESLRADLAVAREAAARKAAARKAAARKAAAGE